MTLDERIDQFLSASPHAVVGASRDRAKYGNKVLRAYQQKGLKVYPINPHAAEIEGSKVYPDLLSLPEPVHGISVITPPEITEQVVEQAAQAGIKHVWMQPGAESPEATGQAHALSMNVIAGEACALVVLGFRED